MKNFFQALSKGKIISPTAVDTGDFGVRIGNSIQAEKVSETSRGEIRLQLRHRLIFVGYTVDIGIRHRRISYSIDYRNVITAIVVAAFAGLLLYSGRLDTYIFWALLISGTVFWLNNVITHGRVRAAIERILPEKNSSAPRENSPGAHCSITQQSTCSACGCVLPGFGSVCPGCGITIGRPTESATRLYGWHLKYFYKK